MGGALGAVSLRRVHGRHFVALGAKWAKCIRRWECAAAMGGVSVLAARHARVGSASASLGAVADLRGTERRMQNGTKRARMTARTWTTARMRMIVRTRIMSELRMITKMMRGKADKALSMRSR